MTQGGSRNDQGTIHIEQYTSEGLYPSGADAPPASLADQFQALKRRLEAAKGNERPAILLEVYRLCFGEQGEMPAYGYLGKVAKEVGGAGRLADLMWQLTTRPPTGDILAYILKSHRGGGDGHRNGSTIRNSLAGPERDESLSDEDRRKLDELREFNRRRRAGGLPSVQGTGMGDARCTGEPP